MGGTDAGWFVGCMSGTSLDGIDAAALLTDGAVIHAFGPTGYRPYSNAEREQIRPAFGCWPGHRLADIAGSIVGNAHSTVLNGFELAATVGFHGQTLAHDPENGRTHQAGNGQRLADATGRVVVWDFRSEDMANGGQGAPLAPFFHFALARWLKQTAPVAFLNLGGVGNITIVDPAVQSPETPGALLAFDTGPANAIIDDFIRLRTGMPCDEGGELAVAGRIDRQVAAEFLAQPWFRRPPPKSLDRNEFGALLDKVSSLTVEAGAATLAACVVGAVDKAFSHIDRNVELTAVCGGGRNNAALLNGLANALPSPVVPVDELGLDGDMLEAQAFAYLASRVMRGLPTSCPGTTGCSQPVCGGRISKPR